MVYIGISYSVNIIWDLPLVIGKPMHFGNSWLDPPVLPPSPYHNPFLDMFQNYNTLLTSLNVRSSGGLEQFHRLNLAKSAQVTSAAKDDWSQAARARAALRPGQQACGVRRRAQAVLVSHARGKLALSVHQS
jgi:hypothetical protein